jgi:flagella basal body P-ring formation protein FlgA
MKHADYEDLLLAELTGSLRDPGERQRLAAHLKTCSRCRALRHEWQLIASAVRSTRPVYTKKGYPMRIALTPHHTTRRVSLTALVALAAALLVITALLVMPRPQMPSAASNLPALEQAATATPTRSTQFVEIVVAGRAIENGAVITDEDVGVLRFPADYAPFNTLMREEDVIGTIARTNIACGLPILQNQLATNASEVPLGQPMPSTDYDCPNGLPPLTDPVGVVEVWIATAPILRGTQIARIFVQARRFPAALVPEGALLPSDIEVAGLYTQQRIEREQVLMRDMVSGEEPDCLLFTVDHIMQPCSTPFIDGNAITATPVPSATMTATSTFVPTATP